MQIDVYGDNSYFFSTAFIGPFDKNFTVTSTSTEITVFQPNTSSTTTLTGTGFVVDGSGNVTAGTITGATFFQNGITAATYSDFSWNAVDLFAAVDAMDIGDQSLLEALYTLQLITLDFRDATAGFRKGDFDIDFNSLIEFQGSGFKDIFTGGGGDDRIFGHGGQDILRGGGGADFIKGGKGTDRLYGGGGDDVIYGGKGHNDIYGGEGDDLLVGGRYSDYIYGGDGNDVIRGGNGSFNVLRGEAGNDRITAGSSIDILIGGDGSDELFGKGGMDRLIGDDGNDVLNGGLDNDILNGGADNDVLTGGKGNDSLSGGTGSDVFVFNGAKNEGHDTINDFDDGLDIIRIIGATAADVFSILQVGSATEITLVSGTEINLEYTDVADIGLADFEFI